MTLPDLFLRPAVLADAPAIARVHVDTWRTTYPGIVPAAHLASLSYERCQAGWVEHLEHPGDEISLVVERAASDVIAFISGGPLREPFPGCDAEVYVLYVLKACQGLGCGRRLLTEIAHQFAAREYKSLLIWVLQENPACRFYEHLGGQWVGSKEVEIGGKTLLDAAYTWPDLAPLIKKG